MTLSGTGFEGFFTSNGHFVVAVITKKEYLTAPLVDVVLADDRWVGTVRFIRGRDLSTLKSLGFIDWFRSPNPKLVMSMGTDWYMNVIGYLPIRKYVHIRYSVQ